MQRRNINGIDQFPGTDLDGVRLQDGCQRGRATLVALLRIKGRAIQLGGCGQLAGELLQQLTGLRGGAAAR